MDKPLESRLGPRRRKLRIHKWNKPYDAMTHMCLESVRKRMEKYTKNEEENIETEPNPQNNYSEDKKEYKGN